MVEQYWVLNACFVEREYVPIGVYSSKAKCIIAAEEKLDCDFPKFRDHVNFTEREKEISWGFGMYYSCYSMHANLLTVDAEPVKFHG